MTQQQNFGEGILPCSSGASISYDKIDGKNPGVIFLHGLYSDKNGDKAKALDAHCRGRGQAFVRYDASGHGASGGTMAASTIGQWLQDALDVIDTLTTGPQILVGSSMGGWIGLLAALKRPERIAGFIGLAAAPDFTEDLMWDTFTPHQQAELLKNGAISIPNCYDPAHPWTIHRHFIEEGRTHRILHSPIALHCPVRLLHGQHDDDVPWRTSLLLSEQIKSQDVRLILIKDADHRISRPQDIKVICQTLDELF